MKQPEDKYTLDMFEPYPEFAAWVKELNEAFGEGEDGKADVCTGQEQ